MPFGILPQSCTTPILQLNSIKTAGSRLFFITDKYDDENTTFYDVQVDEKTVVTVKRNHTSDWGNKTLSYVMDPHPAVDEFAVLNFVKSEYPQDFENCN